MGGKFVINKEHTHQPTDEKHFSSNWWRFTQFMTSKPDNYGETCWVLVDIDVNYLIFPYLGQDTSIVDTLDIAPRKTLVCIKTGEKKNNITYIR